MQGCKIGDHREMGDQRGRSLITTFLPAGVGTCIYTLEEEVLVRCED